MACWPVMAQAAPGQPPWTRQVEEAAREHVLQVADAAGWGAPRIALKVVMAPSAAALSCGIEPAVEPLATRQISRMRFAVLCPDAPGVRGWRQEVVVRGEVSAEVLVSTADIRAGEPLAPAMVTLARQDVTALPDALADEAAIEDQALRRALRSGQVLRAGLLMPAVLVQRRQAVTIQARYSGIEVTQAGEALDAGRRGELVRVRNAASGKVIHARVVAAGVVEPVGVQGVQGGQDAVRIQSPDDREAD